SAMRATSSGAMVSSVLKIATPKSTSGTLFDRRRCLTKARPRRSVHRVDTGDQVRGWTLERGLDARLGLEQRWLVRDGRGAHAVLERSPVPREAVQGLWDVIAGERTAVEHPALL